jgi:hypothetical protein
MCGSLPSLDDEQCAAVRRLDHEDLNLFLQVLGEEGWNEAISLLADMPAKVDDAA